MDSIEKASFLMGKSYTKTQEGAAHSSNVTMITGTATSDSADGVVSVDLGGNTISANDEQAVEISTTCAVKAGDVVQVSVIGADGTAKSLLVTGVIAGGDRMNENIKTASSDASAAKETADVAQTVASDAQSTANAAKSSAATAQSTAEAAKNNAAAAQSTANSAQTAASDASKAAQNANAAADAAANVAQSASQTANTTKTYFYNDSSGSHVRNQDSTSAGTRADVKTDGLHITDQDDGKELASFTSSGAVIGKTNAIHSRTTSTGIQFEDGKKSWAYASIDALTSDPELDDDGSMFSGAYYDSSPDDVATNDGYYHSLSRMYQGSKKGTSSDTPSYAFTGISAVTENANTGVTKTASISVHTASAANTRSNHPETSFASIDADEMYINGFKVPRFIQGSKVLSGFTGKTSAVLFTLDEIKSMLSVSSLISDNLVIVASNGNVEANGAHVESVSLGWNTAYVLFSEKTAGPIRINYLIVYNG